MAQTSQVPVTVLTGFLGAGKTTLISTIFIFGNTNTPKRNQEEKPGIFQDILLL